MELPHQIIAKFTTWPFNICILGESELNHSAIQELQKKKIQGREIQLTFLQKSDNINSCDLLYVTNLKSSDYERIAQTVKDSPVLTVSSTNKFQSIIHFLEIKGKIRLRVNLDTANEVGLKISSELLSISLTN